MIGMAVMGNVGVWGEELPPPDRPTGVPPDYFDQIAKELEGGDSRRLSRAIAGDRAFFRGMFQREKRGLRTNASNSIPFQVRPLLAQANGGYLLSVRSGVIARLDGVVPLWVEGVAFEPDGGEVSV